ncbi:MAG TPA: hypothetical protein VNR39_20755 [Pseudolabrys sp.]|nr:hypothetical protein [Pseudolabrys sp.]
MRPDPKVFLTASWSLATAAALALVVLVATSPSHPIYDEAWFLATVDLLARDGFSLTFLREFPGAAGPTFTLTFAALDSLFGLTFPWLRLINVVLLIATAGLIGRCLAVARPQTPAPLLIGAMLVVLPTAGVAAGMALTEMPAAFFAVMSVALLAHAMVAPRAAALAFSAASGIALAAAILGRQNYLVLLPCLALAIRWRDGRPDRDDLCRVTLTAAIAVALTAPVFIVWGGLVPPRTAWSTAGLALDNAVRGAGYAGVILLLLAPRIYAPLRQPAWLVALALAAAPVAFMLGGGFVPLRATTMTLFGERALTPVGWTAAYLLSFAAVAFAACFTLHLWRHRHEWLTRMSGVAVLLGLMSNAKITHQFSSRYVFIVVPLLVLAAAPALRITRWTPLQMTSAAGISLAALASYYLSG